MRAFPLVGAIALAVLALMCTVGMMHRAHQQTELIAWTPRYMTALAMENKQHELSNLRQQKMMEEGKILIDPNSENPSADFYAEDGAAYADEDDVEDAGEGNILPGWTHPELLDAPRPEDIQSFATGESGAVLKPQDYERTPGAAKTATVTRKAIEKLKADMKKTHQEAEDATAAYEAEKAKAEKMTAEYKQYQQQWLEMRRRGELQAQARAHGMWDPAQTPPRPAGDHKAAAHDGAEEFMLDPEASEDPAAEFRKYFYNKQAEAAQLQAMMARRAAFAGAMAPQLTQAQATSLVREEERALQEHRAMLAAARQPRPVFRAGGFRG